MNFENFEQPNTDPDKLIKMGEQSRAAITENFFPDIGEKEYEELQKMIADIQLGYLKQYEKTTNIGQCGALMDEQLEEIEALGATNGESARAAVFERIRRKVVDRLSDWLTSQDAWDTMEKLEDESKEWKSATEVATWISKNIKGVDGDMFFEVRNKEIEDFLKHYKMNIASRPEDAVETQGPVEA